MFVVGSDPLEMRIHQLLGRQRSVGNLRIQVGDVLRRERALLAAVAAQRMRDDGARTGIIIDNNRLILGYLMVEAVGAEVVEGGDQ